MKRQQRIEDEALDWLVRRDEPGWTPADQLELDNWLGESMAHKAAYWRAEHGWKEADRLRSLGRASNDQGTPTTRRYGNWQSAAAMVGVVLLATMVMVAGTITRRADVPEISQYATATGGHRVISLTDGSKVELNTQTSVRTQVTASRREIWLDTGEAFFEVAHLNGRPFVVHAGARTITVLGTKFSVRRDANNVTVNVLEGRVRVDGGVGDRERAAIIAAGDIAISRGSSTLIATRSEEKVEDALAWRNGMLDFEGATLGEAAEEFNRYNRTKLVLGDMETTSIRIGGSFQAENVDAFARLLHDAYGLDVEKRDNVIRISQR